jgi:hypothetical protein
MILSLVAVFAFLLAMMLCIATSSLAHPEDI